MFVILVSAALAANNWQLRAFAEAYLDARRERAEITAIPSDEERAERLGLIGARRNTALRDLLLEHAAGPLPRIDTVTAQSMLLEHQDGTWPFQAHREYEALGALRMADPGDCPDAGVWWDPRCPAYVDPGASHAWEAFVARWPAFVETDEAWVQIARAYHTEGRHADVLPALEKALVAGDRSTARVIGRGALAYACAWAPEGVLETMGRRSWTEPRLDAAIHYGRVWRRIQRLHFEAARALIRSRSVHTMPAEWHRALYDESRRLDDLAPIERRWRGATDSSERDLAMVELAAAVLAFRELQDGARDGGFLTRALPEDGVGSQLAEPVRHSTVLVAELDRIAARSSDRRLRARAEALAAWTYHSAVLAVCYRRGSPPGAPALQHWSDETTRRIEMLAVRHAVDPADREDPLVRWARRTSLAAAVSPTRAPATGPARCHSEPSGWEPPPI